MVCAIDLLYQVCEASAIPSVVEVVYEDVELVTDVGPDRARAVYGISVAAELVGTGTQNLRAYEARGLLEPERTAGGTRRYSDDDLDRLRRIGDLLDAGLNLAGVAMVMALQDENALLREQQRERR